MSKSDCCPCLSVVIPAYNEEKTLGGITAKVLEIAHLKEVIIVDDCSTDRTATIGKLLSQSHEAVKYIRQPQNGGKTAALKRGFAETTGDIVIVQDADSEYDPGEIPQVIAPILQGYADVVYGSRFLVRKASRVLYFYHFIANKMLTFLSNLFVNMNMSDVETCYKAFRGDIIRQMTIVSDGFGFEIEVTAKVAKLKCRVYEVPISYYGRTYAEGKKITALDGIAAAWYIIWFNLFVGINASFRQPIPDCSSGSTHQSEPPKVLVHGAETKDA